MWLDWRQRKDKVLEIGGDDGLELGGGPDRGSLWRADASIPSMWEHRMGKGERGTLCAMGKGTRVTYIALVSSLIIGIVCTCARTPMCGEKSIQHVDFPWRHFSVIWMSSPKFGPLVWCLLLVQHKGKLWGFRETPKPARELPQCWPQLLPKVCKWHLI